MGTGRPFVAALCEGLDLPELTGQFEEASACALVLVTAATVVEAEKEGVAHIDTALAWLAARSRYGAPTLPGGDTRPFRRTWTTARVSHREIVVVNGLSTGRRWIRALPSLYDRPVLELAEIIDLGEPPLRPYLSPTIRGCLAAWRRAVEESDRLQAVVALWEAVEFYAAGTTAAKLFPKAERSAIVAAARAGLEPAKAARVEEVLSKLNEPSLAVKLRAAVTEDAVPVTEEDFALLKRVREVRNDLVHGRSTQAPEGSDVRHALAIVGRMIVFRMRRLTTTPTAPAPETISADLVRRVSRGDR